MQGERSEPVCAMPMIGLPERSSGPVQAEVHVALEIERRHAGILRIVEPELRAQVPCRAGAAFSASSPFVLPGVFLAMQSVSRRRAGRQSLERFDFAARMRSIARHCKGRAAVMWNQLLRRRPRQPRQFRHPCADDRPRSWSRRHHTPAATDRPACVHAPDAPVTVTMIVPDDRACLRDRGVGQSTTAGPASTTERHDAVRVRVRELHGARLRRRASPPRASG